MITLKLSQLLLFAFLVAIVASAITYKLGYDDGRATAKEEQPPQ